MSEITVMLSRQNLGRRLTCEANSSALHTPMLRSVTIDMDLAPSQLEMKPPVSTFVDEGATVTVTCVAKGAKPPAKIYWNSVPAMDLTDFVEEVTKRGYTYETLNQLTFKAERRLTSLSCFASNMVLDETKATHLTRATTINVKYRPEIDSTTPTDLHYAAQGEGVSLECQYEANPMAGTVVHWYKDGHIIDYDPRVFERVGHDSAVLKINPTHTKLSGTYSCSAENEVGKSRIVPVATLVVEERPSVSLSVEPASAVNELLNANVTLVCNSERLDERFLAVKWFLDGDLLQQVALAPECDNETVVSTANDQLAR